MKALGSSSGECASEERFGQEGKAQMGLPAPRDGRRGKRSRRELAGDGGGAAGEVEMGEGGEVLMYMVMVMIVAVVVITITRRATTTAVVEMTVR